MSLRKRSLLILAAAIAVLVAVLLFRALASAEYSRWADPLLALLGLAALFGAVLWALFERLLLTRSERRASEQRYQILAEAAHDSIFIVNREFVIQYVNTFGADQFNKRRTEIVGKSIHELFPPEISSGQKANLDRVFATGEPAYNEQLSEFAGRKVWLDTRLVPIRDEGGTIHSVLGIARDITERKHIEEDLRDKVASLQTLAEIEQAITSKLGLSERMDILLEHTLTRMRADIGTVYMVIPRTNELELFAQQGTRHSSYWRNLRLKIGEGAAGWVAAHAEPLAITEVAGSAQWQTHETSASETIMSYLGVPLRIEGHVIGVLAIATRTRREFSKEEIEFLATLGGRAAVSIQNARLFDETQQRAREFSALYDTTRDLAGQQDVSMLLQTIVDHATNLLAAASGGIYLYDGARNDLILSVSKGSHLEVGLRLALGEGIAGRVALTHQPVIIDNDHIWPQRPPPFDGSPFAALVQVPMVYGGQLIGVLAVNETAASRRFGEADVRLLSLFAAQAASAVHNARLFEETKTRAQQLALLYDAGLALNSVLEPRSQLEFLFRIALKTLHAERAELFRYNMAGQTFEFELGIGYDPEQMSKLSSLSCSLQDENSIVAHVCRSRLPLYIPNVAADPRWVVIDPQIRSGIWVPIEHENQLRGVLGIMSSRVNGFSAQDERLLVLFANQASVAMENARLFSEAQRQLQELSLLNQISANLNQPLALEQVLNNTLRELANALHVDRGGVSILSQSRQQLLIVAEYNPAQGRSLLGKTVPVADNPWLDYIRRERRPLALADVENEPVLGNMAASLRDIGARSVLIVPLISQDQIVGAIGLDSVNNQRTFTEAEIVLAQTIANQAAAATEKARLFEETRRRADRLAVLNRIASAVNLTLQLDEVLDVIYREVTAAVTADAFFIVLCDTATNELDYRILVDQGVREAPVRRPLSDGFAAKIIRTRQSLLIRNLEEEGHRFPDPQLWGSMKTPHSLLGVPLQAGANPVGVICVQSYRPNAFGEEEERLLTTVADQVGVVIEKARLFEETRRRALEQTTISEVASALNASLDVRQAFPKVVRGLRTLADCDRVSVALLDETGEQISFFLLDETRPERSSGTSQATAASSANAAADADQGASMGPVPNDAGFQSRVNLPLLVGDQVIGTLNLASRLAGAFNSGQVPALQQIANALAFAIQNTRLLEAEQTRRAELAALYELSRALADTADFDEILNVVTRRALDTLHVTFARVALLEGSELVFRAVYPLRMPNHDLQSGLREPASAQPYCRRVLEGNVPTLVQSDDPELTPHEREVLFAGVEVLCLVPLRVGEHTLGVLILGEAWRTEQDSFSTEKVHQARSIADQAASALRRAELFAELERAYLQTVLSLANAVDAKDTYTADHGARLADLALGLGQELGMSRAELEDLRYGALLHDIGKIGIPDAILQKPAQLDEDEWKRMRLHPEIGSEILRPVPRLAGAARIIRHHHERFDGTGYPDRLAGQAIPLGARLLAVVDAYSAITDKRVYKEACPEEIAIAELKQNAGTQFDPRLVEMFLQLLDKR